MEIGQLIWSPKTPNRVYSKKKRTRISRNCETINRDSSTDTAWGTEIVQLRKKGHRNIRPKSVFSLCEFTFFNETFKSHLENCPGRCNCRYRGTKDRRWSEPCAWSGSRCAPAALRGICTRAVKRIRTLGKAYIGGLRGGTSPKLEEHKSLKLSRGLLFFTTKKLCERDASISWIFVSSHYQTDRG